MQTVRTSVKESNFVSCREPLEQSEIPKAQPIAVDASITIKNIENEPIQADDMAFEDNRHTETIQAEPILLTPE